VRGTVTQLANFGAFARIEDGIEGLIHVSELTDERITHPKQVVREGQDLILRIIRIDPQRRRMGLSLRRALDTPDAELTAVLGEGTVEERDQIVQTIRAALEAEGIEIGSGRSASDEEGADQESGELAATASVDGPRSFGANDSESASAARDETGAPAPVGIVVTQDSVEVAEPAIETPTAGSGGGRSRNQRQNRDMPTDIDGEPLSAIGMAFAMAGAALDLDDDATEEKAAASDGEGSEG